MANAFLDSYIKGQDESRQQGLAAMQQRATAIQTAGALQSLQEANAAREAVARLGPNASQEDVIKALRPHVAPDKLIGLMQTAETQRLNRDSRAQTALANLDAHRKQFYDSLEVRRKLGEDANALRAEAMNFDQQYKAERLKYDTGAVVTPSSMPGAAPQPVPAPMPPPPPPMPQPPQNSAPAPIPQAPAAAEVPAVAPSTFATLSQAQSGGLEGRFPPVGVTPTPATGYNGTMDKPTMGEPAPTPLPPATPTLGPQPLTPTTPIPAAPKPLSLADAPQGLTPRKAQEWLLAQTKPSIAGGGDLTPAALQLKAEQALAGDKSALTGFARNQKNMVALSNAVADLAAKRGINGKELAAITAEYVGFTSGQRTVGTRQAQIEIAANVTDQFAPIAIDASEKFDRTEWKSLNDIQKAVDSHTASPELRRFNFANNSLVNAYARAINPTGQGNEHDKRHAYEILDTGFSKGDYRAAVEQLQVEINAELRAPGTVKRQMREGFTNTPDMNSSAPTSAPPMALQYLKAHPETKDAFKAKFGYLP